MFTMPLLCVPLILSVPAPNKGFEPETASWVGKSIIVTGTVQQIGQLDAAGRLTPPLTMLFGIEFRVYGERDQFVQLKTREGVSGWIAKKDVVLVKDAIVFFSRRLEANPTNVYDLNLRGWAWSLRGEHEAGIKDMTEALRLTPQMAFLNNRARILVKMGEYDRGLEDYDLAIKMGPEEYLPYFNRGSTWLLKKNYDKALADFDRSLQLNAKFALCYQRRGLGWHAKREYANALADFGKALELDPKLAAALADRGHTWLAKGELSAARGDLDDALRADASNESAYCYRGELRHREKKYEDALADFAQAIRLNPAFMPAYQQRAATWSRLKQYAKARTDLERIILMEPKNADTYAALALFLASCSESSQRDGKRAVALALKGVALEKTNANVLEALAAAHAEVGEFEDAIRVQQHALESPLLQDEAAARQRLELYRKKQPYRQD